MRYGKTCQSILKLGIGSEHVYSLARSGSTGPSLGKRKLHIRRIAARPSNAGARERRVTASSSVVQYAVSISNSGDVRINVRSSHRT